MQPVSWQNIWRVVKYPVLLGLLIWIFWQSLPSFQKVISQSPRYDWLIASLVVYHIGIFLISERFRLMLKSIGVIRTYWQCFFSYLTSVPYFFISPGGIGVDVVRYQKLKMPDDPEDHTHRKIIFGLLLDRVIGLISGIIVALLGWAVLADIMAERFSPIQCVLALTALPVLAGFAVWFILCRFPSLKATITDILYFGRANPAGICMTMILGVVCQLSLGITTYCIAKAMHVDVSLLTVVWVTAAGMVFLVIPASLFGFTMMDTSVILFYMSSGMNLQDATLLSLIGYVMRLWLGIEGVVLEFLSSLWQGAGNKILKND